MLSEIQINIFSEFDRIIQKKYALITLSGIVKELQGLLINSKTKKRKKVEFALQFLKSAQVKILNEELLSSETIDEYIIRIAKKSNFIVATNDQDLRHKLRIEGISIIYLRQRSHLVLDGYVG
ncbi:MAG: PIN domain-containing protein [Promethearchaeota archaeon]